METQKLKFSENETRQGATRVLYQIMKGLDSGRLLMTRGEDHIELVPSGPIKLRVKVKQKGETEQVKLELSWSRNDLEGLVAQVPIIDVPRLSNSTAAPNNDESAVLDAGGALEDVEPEGVEPDKDPGADVESVDRTRDICVTERWITKERLHELATECKLPGRSALNKEELVRCLFDAGVNPLQQLRHKELYLLAQHAEIGGRSAMSQDELIAALRTAVSS